MLLVQEQVQKQGAQRLVMFKSESLTKACKVRHWRISLFDDNRCRELARFNGR
jgi:hypothetical protein